MKGAVTILKQEDKSILLKPSIAKYSLIWLHGLGDTSRGFLDYFDIPDSPAYNGARVKLLHAPVRPVTINGGDYMPSWYDIKVLGFSSLKQEEKCSLAEVKQSLEILNQKVQEQAEYWRSQKVDGDVYKRIFVGGFSQGCAISVFYGLTAKIQLGGIIGFSGYLFNFEGFELSNLGKVPILLNHGNQDSMVDFAHAKKSYERLLNGQNNVTFRQKRLAHEVSFEQLKEMNAWLQNLTKDLEGKE